MAHQHQPEPVDVPGTPSLSAPTEPALAVGTIAAAVGAILALLIAFGFNLSPGQHEAVLGLVAVFGPILIAIVTRGKVWSPAAVARKVQQVRQGGK